MLRFAIATLLASTVTADNGLTVSMYENGALSGTPSKTYTITSLDKVSESGVGSISITGTLTFPILGWHNFTCEFAQTSLAMVWVDGHEVCTDAKYLENWSNPKLRGEIDNPIMVREKKDLAFRVHLYRNSSIPASTATTFSMKWSLNGSSSITSIPLSAMTTEMSPSEQEREALQKEVQRGWGNWNQHSILDIVKLPDSAVLTTMLCNKNDDCITDTRIELDRGNDCYVRVGMYAGDQSYTQFYFGQSKTVSGNVSVEYTSTETNDLTMLITPQTVEQGHKIRIAGRFAWWRSGEYTIVSGNEVTFQGTGFDKFTMYIQGNTTINGNFIDISLDNGPITISTLKSTTVQSARSDLTAAHETRMNYLRTTFKDRAEVALAIEASAMWNLVYVPLENGPLFPVSRSWNFVHDAATTDFDYVIFDWDNLFASLLGALTNKKLGYSNFIQTMKSKTSDGFVPNYEAGGMKEEDRTEPPVGAKVLEELYNRYGDKWLVELVFDDLLDWQAFFLRERLLEPLNLVCLGSYNVLVDKVHAGSATAGMQGGRWESGLDNSPMYDGEFFNSTTHQMMLYDMGMTSMLAQEAQSLAYLADQIGRPEKQMLLDRAAHFRALLADNLWDEKIGTFSNKFPNGTFYERISPTTFYPLQVRAATDEQADSMVTNWLLNKDRFCISPTGDSKGNGPDCYWGLPSIQAGDPAFPPLGYWRGYVWGPMAQLTYWSLKQYNTTIVNQGRKAMTNQLTSLMMSQWNRNRHICENYGPHQNTTDCTGTQFYHWGALTGMITLMEEQYW
eukprot:TRINITY_DN719_c0_g1_i2.p1 TRINITY_DN719_c0_g1~~TRINITY_DN719_c0_g1_i2.p1  ORF type:complete len:789 (+),score=161.32 TRINITY_DN719_c0_g1_i2:881-3247(+)